MNIGYEEVFAPLPSELSKRYTLRNSVSNLGKSLISAYTLKSAVNRSKEYIQPTITNIPSKRPFTLIKSLITPKAGESTLNTTLEKNKVNPSLSEQSIIDESPILNEIADKNERDNTNYSFISAAFHQAGISNLIYAIGGISYNVGQRVIELENWLSINNEMGWQKYQELLQKRNSSLFSAIVFN